MFMVDVGAASHYAVLGVSPSASTAEIRQARDHRILRLRTEGRSATPGRKAELSSEEQSVNAAAEELVRPARREEYDRDHPDLRLFTRRPVAASVFTDRTERVAVLYRVLLEHLAQHDAWSHTPSDLFRTDFTADESPNPILDSLIAQRRH